MKFIDIVAGTRPNFVKIAPLFHKFKSHKNYNKKFKIRIIHTGQHYDSEMSEVFFRDLRIPKPDVKFILEKSRPTSRVGEMIVKYDEFLNRTKKPDLVIVVGDVDSTIAISLAAKKNKILIAHVESGLRSNLEFMQEEINRRITDHLSSIFYVTTTGAKKNLIKEGINKDKIVHVGNIMIDSLNSFNKKIKEPLKIKKLKPNDKYIVLTIHRDENTKIINSLIKVIHTRFKKFKIIFPVHPRVKKIIYKNKLDNFVFIKPQSYLKFIQLIKNSELVITDSGGISEETTIMQIPCLTLRSETERPETVKYGTNILVGNNYKVVRKNLSKKINLSPRVDFLKKNQKWDGKTSIRVVEDIEKKGFLK